jgi:hypothetical protein
MQKLELHCVYAPRNAGQRDADAGMKVYEKVLKRAEGKRFQTTWLVRDWHGPHNLSKGLAGRCSHDKRLVLQMFCQTNIGEHGFSMFIP